MSSPRQPGIYPEDLSPEKLEQLLREGYTVSPNSGRLRKKITTKKKTGFFSKRKVKKYSRIALWALLIIAFLVSLVIIVPEMSVQNNPRNPDYTKQRR
jgi:hypothetical protein